MKTFIITLLFAVLGVPTVCRAIDLPQKIETTDGFTLYLPSDWISIPGEVVDAAARTAAKKIHTKTPSSNYILQLSAAKKGLDFPYIFIEVKRTGRIRESLLEAVKEVSNENSFEMKMTYDPQAHILWGPDDIRLDDGVVVRVLAGRLLTEEGSIQFQAVAKKQDYQHYHPIFEAIIKSTLIADSLRYKPRKTDTISAVGGSNWSLVLVGTLFGAFIVGLFLVLATLCKKYKDQVMVIANVPTWLRWAIIFGIIALLHLIS